MNREQYIQKRQELLGKAENCIKSGNLDEFKSFETQIKDLDTQFESEAKAQADLQALSNNAIGMQEDAINNIFDNNVTCLWRDGYGEGTFGKTTGGSCEWSRRSSRDFMGTGKKSGWV